MVNSVDNSISILANVRAFFVRLITKTRPCNIQQYLTAVKMFIFGWIFFNIFLIFAQNIDSGYTLEPPQSGGSNEYPQSMLWSKNKKKVYPCKPQLYYIKVGCKGVFVTRTCFRDV